MIIVTGAAGFIGSRMVNFLNNKGITDVLAIDRSTQLLSTDYLNDTTCIKSIVGSKSHADYKITAVIHIGAISDTLEKDWIQFNRFNVLSTLYWRDFCKLRGIPFVWASSSAVYGNGAGPLNQYATSKLLSEQQCVNECVALRFFNVYGAHEYHKGRMASVIYNWYCQYNNTNTIKVFENSNLYHRDLIYVDDVCNIIWYMVENYKPGIYDVGTGTAENMEKIASSVLSTLGATDSSIIKIPMPHDLTTQYQRYTCANLEPLQNTGFDISTIRPLSVGIKDYLSIFN